jgi:transcriptional regulator with XRE-family HTH domain
MAEPLPTHDEHGVRMLLLCLTAGRTQRQLAQEIGVSPQFLNDILHGKRVPSGKVLDYLGFERVVLYRPREEAPDG